MVPISNLSKIYSVTSFYLAISDIEFKNLVIKLKKIYPLTTTQSHTTTIATSIATSNTTINTLVSASDIISLTVINTTVLALALSVSIRETTIAATSIISSEVTIAAYINSIQVAPVPPDLKSVLDLEV